MAVTVYTVNGKVLLVGGKWATSSSCCCGDCFHLLCLSYFVVNGECCDALPSTLTAEAGWDDGDSSDSDPSGGGGGGGGGGGEGDDGPPPGTLGYIPVGGGGGGYDPDYSNDDYPPGSNDGYGQVVGIPDDSSEEGGGGGGGGGAWGVVYPAVPDDGGHQGPCAPTTYFGITEEGRLADVVFERGRRGMNATSFVDDVVGGMPDRVPWYEDVGTAFNPYWIRTTKAHDPSLMRDYAQVGAQADGVARGFAAWMHDCFHGLDPTKSELWVYGRVNDRRKDGDSFYPGAEYGRPVLRIPDGLSFTTLASSIQYAAPSGGEDLEFALWMDPSNEFAAWLPFEYVEAGYGPSDVLSDVFFLYVDVAYPSDLYLCYGVPTALHEEVADVVSFHSADPQLDWSGRLASHSGTLPQSMSRRRQAAGFGAENGVCDALYGRFRNWREFHPGYCGNLVDYRYDGPLSMPADDRRVDWKTRLEDLRPFRPGMWLWTKTVRSCVGEPILSAEYRVTTVRSGSPPNDMQPAPPARSARKAVARDAGDPAPASAPASAAKAPKLSVELEKLSSRPSCSDCYASGDVTSDAGSLEVGFYVGFACVTCDKLSSLAGEDGKVLFRVAPPCGPDEYDYFKLSRTSSAEESMESCSLSGISSGDCSGLPEGMSVTHSGGTTRVCPDCGEWYKVGIDVTLKPGACCDDSDLPSELTAISRLTKALEITLTRQPGKSASGVLYGGVKCFNVTGGSVYAEEFKDDPIVFDVSSPNTSPAAISGCASGSVEVEVSAVSPGVAMLCDCDDGSNDGLTHHGGAEKQCDGCDEEHVVYMRFRVGRTPCGERCLSSVSVTYHASGIDTNCMLLEDTSQQTVYDGYQVFQGCCRVRFPCGTGVAGIQSALSATFHLDPPGTTAGCQEDANGDVAVGSFGEVITSEQDLRSASMYCDGGSLPDAGIVYTSCHLSYETRYIRLVSECCECVYRAVHTWCGYGISGSSWGSAELECNGDPVAGTFAKCSTDPDLGEVDVEIDDGAGHFHVVLDTWTYDPSTRTYTFEYVPGQDNGLLICVGVESGCCGSNDVPDGTLRSVDVSYTSGGSSHTSEVEFEYDSANGVFCGFLPVCGAVSGMSVEPLYDDSRPGSASAAVDACGTKSVSVTQPCRLKPVQCEYWFDIEDDCGSNDETVPADSVLSVVFSCGDGHDSVARDIVRGPAGFRTVLDSCGCPEPEVAGTQVLYDDQGIQLAEYAVAGGSPASPCGGDYELRPVGWDSGYVVKVVSRNIVLPLLRGSQQGAQEYYQGDYSWNGQVSVSASGKTCIIPVVVSSSRIGSGMSCATGFAVPVHGQAIGSCGFPRCRRPACGDLSFAFEVEASVGQVSAEVAGGCTLVSCSETGADELTVVIDLSATDCSGHDV